VYLFLALGRHRLISILVIVHFSFLAATGPLGDPILCVHGLVPAVHATHVLTPFVEALSTHDIRFASEWVDLPVPNAHVLLAALALLHVSRSRLQYGLVCAAYGLPGFAAAGPAFGPPSFGTAEVLPPRMLLGLTNASSAAI
jgi:hypothetical protein